MSYPRHSKAYLSRFPRETLSFGVHEAAMLPGPGEMLVLRRGCCCRPPIHPAPQLSFSLSYSRRLSVFGLHSTAGAHTFPVCHGASGVREGPIRRVSVPPNFPGSQSKRAPSASSGSAAEVPVPSLFAVVQPRPEGVWGRGKASEKEEMLF